MFVHGDRGEHLMVAFAALNLGIAVAHTQGGDRSGNIDELQPNTAPLVADGIETRAAGASDIGAGCTGLLSALAAATAQIETSRAEHVGVVGADSITRINNYDTIIVTHGERKIRMDGPEVFRHAVNGMGKVSLLALERAGLGLDDIDLFVYHQANARITRTLGQRLGLPSERVVDCIEHYGNASAATIPLALTVALEDGRLQGGANVLLCAFGSGFTWGAGVVRWGTAHA